jgi:hypothetical protein
MGAQMNIKNAEATALAGELAARTGASVTQVVLEALRARKRELDKARKVDEILQFCRETRAMMSPEALAFDIDKELYDAETGLPK